MDGFLPFSPVKSCNTEIDAALTDPPPQAIRTVWLFVAARPPVWNVDCVLFAAGKKKLFAQSASFFRIHAVEYRRRGSLKIYVSTLNIIKLHGVLIFFFLPPYLQSRRLFDRQAFYKSNQYFTSQHLTASGCISLLRGAGWLTYIRRETTGLVYGSEAGEFVELLE